MPDEINIGTDVKAVLDRLEHYSLKNHLCRTQNYNKILTALEKDDLSLTETERLLAICVHDLREDMRYTATIMNIIPVIISKVQMGRYSPNPDLLPSALAVIYIIKTAALQSKVESLKQLCFDTLSSYPNDTLIAVAEQHQEIMEILNLYCQMRIPTGMRLQACFLVTRLIKILPPEKKRQFVEKGVSVWFSKIIPTCMHSEVIEHVMSVELLELLTEELIAIDYTDNQHWHYILECICSSQKYPAIMKTLLQKGSDVWHRIWILFIRLLKHQVTQPLGNVGTPINSMLPVVEAAFKVDVANRCKAFQCWSVLIDSFSTETSESNINKRIKLLIIPLKSNNAKVEITALAKFKCWWRLLGKFQNKIDKFIDTFMVSFLHFCFGKHNITDKSPLIPGQISVAVKKQCIQALVEMVGHVNCDGCTDLPKLSGKLINTKNLVDNWNHWVFSLTSAIMMSANPDHGLTKQQMTCLWKSYLMTIGELPENNIRKDLFSEMLSILLHLVKECKSNAKYSETVFNALILSLFDGDIRIKQLLKTRVNDENHPLCKIIMVILDPSLHLAYQSCSFKEMVTELRRVTDVLLDPVYSEPTFVVGFVLQNLTANDMSLTFWTALAESLICESQNIKCEKVFCEIILWPLQLLYGFTDVKFSAMTWCTMYDLLHPKLKYNEIFEKAISTFLFNVTEVSHSTIYFKLCVSLCVLKHKMVEQSCSACEKELELLHIVTSRIDNYNNYEQLFPLLVDRVIATISIIVTNINETAARYILFCMKKMIKVLTLTCKQETDASHVLSFIDSLLKALDSLIQVETYQRFIPVIVDEIIDCSSFLSQQALTKSTVLYVMRTLKSKIVDETDITFKKIKVVIDNIENETMAKEKIQTPDKNKFTTPRTKEVPKRTKKKEASIVNTVVENGEEYLVVKSNWKFNPRKLTENQKEKLQRKREDIPALYQDLSQSQDEFKLVSWKTDSQDTSNSSKSESKSCKSGSNETATEMLSNLPSSNVVPKILESFFAENIKKDLSIAKDIQTPADKKANKVEVVTPKNTKSPRMALKDRVFRNVRNLMENSGVQKENKSASVDLNKTESFMKTPTQSKSDDTANIVNSAPSLISADRPSRVKRKPKKFDELQLLVGAKKSRQSLQDLKSKCESMQSNPDTTPLKNASAEDANPPKDAVPDKDEANKLNDLHVPEHVNISGVNEVIQSNENLQKDESDILNEKDLNKEVLDIDIEIKEKYTDFHLNACMDTDKNDEITDEQKFENSIENKVERPTENKVESSTVKKVASSAEKKLESSAEKKVNSSAEKKVNSSAEKKVEISTKKKVEGSTEKRLESSAENKIESSTEKKVESSAEKKVESSIEKNVESSNEKKVDSSGEKKVDSSGEKKVESFNDKKSEGTNYKEGETCNAIKPKESNIEREKSNDIQGQSPNDNKDKSFDKKEKTPNSKNGDNSSEKQTSPNIKDAIEPLTPQQESKNKVTEEQKSTTKKTVRKSRIEKELAIDMVEGHPYLKMQSQKRLTRKALESAGTDRRKSLVEKLNKLKSEAKTDKKTKEKNKDSDSSSSNSSLTVDDSQTGTEIKDQTSFTEDLPYSDDVIESSQDSTITTISVKSTKKASKRVPVVTLEKINLLSDKADKINESQSILDCVMVGVSESAKANEEGKDDSEFPLNKTALEGPSQADLTENMDTEPIEDLSEVVIIVNDDVLAPLTISSDEIEVGPETQEIAEADTQPTDPNNFMEVDVVHKNIDTSLTVVDITTDEICSSKRRKSQTKNKSISERSVYHPEDITITLSDSAVVELEKESGASSPSSFGDDAKRKQDFLNNTLEISPIKNMSPERTKKSPSPDTSGDYVVITLSSPVHSNGEPIEKCGSPEVFTEDRVSPDKRDQSPPRVEVTVTNTSPSSSLSLKKNKPQVRAGGRAAQMLGLCCVPDKVQAIINQEKAETEEIKKNSTSSTPARRNLRILYNSVSENVEPLSENEDSDKFLKFRRSLPAVDSSPVGPILKRKLVEIADEATISPASKRKRVSFHDPPVSTTVSVQKYIEPGGVRSPQNSAHKRIERQLRQNTPIKSPKRLDHAFKLDTVLNRAVESFTVTTVISTPDDTQPSSLDTTPVVEIVRASELNDTDPICPDLVDCKDAIDNIAGELSSFAMKSLLVKELVGKVETVGDLAKMTELEVNRLCIKAPKVKVARKVLTDYASKRADKPPCDVMVTIDEAIFDEPMPDPDLKSYVDSAAQTFTNVGVETEVQTVATPTTVTFVQTETTPTANTVVQTDESGSKSTADIVKSCLAERHDFVEQVSEHLEDSSIQHITEKLPFSAITDVLMKKITTSDAKALLNRVLENQWNKTTEQNRSSKELSFIREYMCERFEPKDLILFCSEVLKSVYDKPAFP